MSGADPAFPALHGSFERCSANAQRRFALLTRGSLSATVLAAAAGVVSLGDGPDWAAVISLLAFLAAGGCRVVLLQERPERAWYDARAGAESVKTLSWQYAVGGGAFRIDDGGAGSQEAARERLTQRLRDLVRESHGLSQPPPADARQVTDWMAELRRSSLDHRRDSYRVQRLDDQIHWYGGAAERNGRLAGTWSRITIGLQAAGLVAAVLRVTGTVDIDLMGVAAAAAAASTAWLESQDHSGLAEAYSVTAHELALVRDDIPRQLAEEGWATFVADAEAAISREHTSWLARRRALGSRGGT